MEGGTYKEPWQTKEVLDPGIEPNGTMSIIDNIFEYTVECVYHFILTNHTSKQSDIEKILSFYATIEENDKEFAEKVLKVQQNCEPNTFKQITKKFGELSLPTYGNPSEQQLEQQLGSRVFHLPNDYLSNGSATKEEILKFISSSLNEILESIFSHREIKHVVKKLISSLADSEKRLEYIGEDVSEHLSYGLADYFKNLEPDVPDFHKKMSSSITNFIGYFALHTIRHHCYVNFDVGKLKFYRRDMYEEAVKDSKEEAKSLVRVKSEKKCKSESTKKDDSPKVIRVKAEISKDSDDDYCEVISPPAKGTTKRRPASESTIKVQSTDVAEDQEKEMLEELKKDELPMNFKTRFRKLTEQNQMLRQQISEYREMISLKIAEKKQKLS